MRDLIQLYATTNIRVAELERENTALRADLLIEEERSIYWRDNEGKAMAENSALRADKERLDWLLTPLGSQFCYGHLRDNFVLTSAAIDAERKEAQS